VRRGTVIALIVGVTAVAAAVVHAGTAAVARAVESLRISGLLLLVLLHLPIVVLMGFAWWLVSGEDLPASRVRFLWARFVRDAGGEVLPFLQFGGIALGLRALGRGHAVTVGAVSAGIDGVIELTAKLPYAFAALLTLLALAPQSHLARPLTLALCATSSFLAILLFARRSLSASLESLARVISRRWPAIFLVDTPAVVDIQASFDRILSRHGRLWSAFALHLCCWCLGAAEAWAAFRLLGVDLTFLQALAADGTVVGLRTFGFMVPASAGVQEASYILAAAVFGITPATALAASFTRRARDLVLGVGILFIAAVWDANFATNAR
jgi:glycosyltransferase 2 family protein